MSKFKSKLTIEDYKSDFIFKKKPPIIADNIGAIATITNVFATLVFCIDIRKVILQIAKLII